LRRRPIIFAGRATADQRLPRYDVEYDRARWRGKMKKLFRLLGMWLTQDEKTFLERRALKKEKGLLAGFKSREEVQVELLQELEEFRQARKWMSEG
jgi:hypothetical protein